jgi:hypothetical protein
MKFVLPLLLFFAVACQDYNANTFDRDRFGVVELTGSASFKASYPILKTNCMNCHEHANWSEFTDEQDWTKGGLVVFGDAAHSPLINRIKNFGGAGSDMPQGGSALPTSEYDTLRTWVQP